MISVATAVCFKPGGDNLTLPKDVNMLLSYVNMGLRDKYEDLYDMASSEGFDAKEIRDKLEAAGFCYDEGIKKFVTK